MSPISIVYLSISLCPISLFAFYILEMFGTIPIVLSQDDHAKFPLAPASTFAPSGL